jgi:uncharacterized protein YfbU (UPF0304 family)
MSLKTKVELAIEGGPTALPSITQMEVTGLPHEGSFLQHWEEGTSYLLRVTAVVDSNQGATVYSIYEGETLDVWPDILREKQSALSRFERLVLCNQLELEKKGKPASEKKRISADQEILKQGFEVYYECILQAVDRSTIADEDCRFVLNVLNMYSSFQRFIAANNGHVFASHPWFNFPGFDGNGESEGMYLALTNFVISTKRLFKELELDSDEKDLNSHCPCAEPYRRMLATWEKQPNKYFLNAEGLKQILDAAAG